MPLSTTAEYALRAVLHIATQPGAGATRVSVLAESTGLPRNYLSKILHQLVRAGVLRSMRGPTGGFALARPAHGITLGAVITPFVDRVPRRCLLHDRPCGGDTPCAVHARWAPVSTQLDAFFGVTTIADLTDGVDAMVDADAPQSLLHSRSVADGRTFR